MFNLSFFISVKSTNFDRDSLETNMVMPLDVIPQTNADEDPKFVSSFTFDYDAVNNLHLIYNEQQVNYNKLIYVQSDSDYQWNLTQQIILEENNSLVIFGQPSMEITTDKIWCTFPYEKGDTAGVMLYSKELSTNKWESQILFSNESISISSPLMEKIPDKDAFFFVWKDDHEGSFNFYSMYYNITTQQLYNYSRITSNSGSYCLNMKFIIDNENNTHFVWAEGETNFERILYRILYENNTLSPIEYLTDGFNRCKFPVIIQDSQGLINVFWTNYTKINPGTEYGTININTAKKYSTGNWSDILDVAPYIPTERPPGSESDAENPTVTLDKENNLWLAYEIKEQYLNHIGVDIRHRSNSGWQAGEKVSLVICSTLDPLIKADNVGNLHCMWRDIRYGSYDVIYRIRFVSGLWSDEIRLTNTSINYGGPLIRNIGIVFAVLIAVTVPMFFLNRMRARRVNKEMKKKINDLND